MKKQNIPILTDNENFKQVEVVAKTWNLPIRALTDQDTFFFRYIKNRLQLENKQNAQMGAVYCEFAQGSLMYRRKFGGGRSQAIAKAVGFKGNMTPSVLDATAGLGSDGFILASLGARVHMVEKSPIVAALLEDGLNRAREDKDIGGWVKKNMTYAWTDFLDKSLKLPFKPDVIYLDPMFPPKSKSAKVKKNMNMLQDLLGYDENADELLAQALKHKPKRVVVKRPAYADHLDNKTPDTIIETKKYRFDVYFL